MEKKNNFRLMMVSNHIYTKVTVSLTATYLTIEPEKGK